MEPTGDIQEEERKIRFCYGIRFFIQINDGKEKTFRRKGTAHDPEHTTWTCVMVWAYMLPVEYVFLCLLMKWPLIVARWILCRDILSAHIQWRDKKELIGLYSIYGKLSLYVEKETCRNQTIFRCLHEKKKKNLVIDFSFFFKTICQLQPIKATKQWWHLSETLWCGDTRLHSVYGFGMSGYHGDRALPNCLDHFSVRWMYHAYF